VNINATFDRLHGLITEIIGQYNHLITQNMQLEAQLAITENALELSCQMVHGNGCPMFHELWMLPHKEKPYRNIECDKCTETYGDKPPIAKCWRDYYLQQAKENIEKGAEKQCINIHAVMRL
jgi:hypothetical protein